MVGHDVSYKSPGRGVSPASAEQGEKLVARLHVDLCRLASAICPS